MLKTIVEQLNREQRALLHEFGVDSSMLSRWRTGKRLPTEPQAAFLAQIAHANLTALRDEITLARATPEQRTMLERAMGKLQRGAVETLSFGAAGLAALAAGYDQLATMYRGEERRSKPR